MYVCGGEKKRGLNKLILICLLSENLLVQVYDIFCDIIFCVTIFIGSRYIFRPCI